MPDDEPAVSVETPPSDEVAVESPVLAFFESEGQLEIAGGNRPFLLNGVDNLWFVESGNVEVFTVQVQDATATISRPITWRVSARHKIGLPDATSVIEASWPFW